MKTLAILISGSGSNLRTIAQFCQAHPHLARAGVVISNKAGVGGLEIAKEFGIPAVFIPTKGRTIAEFEAEIQKYLNGVDLICLAGFMRVLTSEFTQQWHGKMVNIHPSLLPAFKGGNAVEDALNFGVKITGCSVHFVEPEIDSGKIITQKAVEIQDGDTKASLHSRIKQAEKLAYTQALQILCK